MYTILIREVNTMGRVIFHSDINSCFANIEVMYDPSLRGKPLSVCGSVDDRHGIVLASTAEAKACGVRTGEAIWQAREKCPDLVVVEPHYDRYLRISRLSRSIYGEYTDLVEPFGLDECFLDVTGNPRLRDDGGESLAEELRQRIKDELGVTVSVGASDNKIFAKLGSDMKKPDAVTVITRDNFRRKVWPLPVRDLLMVGRATAGKLQARGIDTIGDLANCDPAALHSWLGKWGYTLHAFANGQDRTPVSPAGEERVVKSIGNGATMPRDLMNMEDALVLFTALSESVAQRLREQGFEARTVSITVRDCQLNWFERQMSLPRPTDLSGELCRCAMELLRRSYNWERPIRSIGIRAANLCPAGSPAQLSLYEDEGGRIRRQALERAVDDIRRRFGHYSIARAVTLTDPILGHIDPIGEHVAYPVGFVPGG